MKKIVIFTVILGIISLIFVSYSQGKTKSYYSGDSLIYQDKLYIVTANTGNLELFRLEGDNLNRLEKIKPFDQRFNKFGSFYDAHLRIEDSKLYVYAVSDFSLYKYEVKNERSLSLVTSVKNSYWEWYNRVDDIGSRLATISAKSVKIWNNDMQVIDEYTFSNEEIPYNVSGNDHFLFNIQNGKLYIYDRESRTVIREIALNFKNNKSAHKVYLDENENLYVVDDYYAKKFNLEGNLLDSFKHLDYEGFDMGARSFSQYVYFSNGVGVVKLNKETMSVNDWTWTGGIAGPRGWAMGLDVVNLNGDKVVVFNNANILVLDVNLNKVASFQAQDEEDEVYATENLFLNMDKNRAAINSQVSLNGGGFLPNEDLKIDFAGIKQNAKSDQRGRFTQILNVPDKPIGVYDIKVEGVTSKMSYSMTFKIE